MFDNQQHSPSLVQANSETAAAAPHQVLISDEKLKQLYAAMLKLRLLNEQLSSRVGKARPRARLQEACEAGCIIDLRPQDTVACGTDEALATFVGSSSFNSSNGLDGQQPGMAATSRTSPPTLLQIDKPSDRLMLATGAAFAYRAQKTGNLVIAFNKAEILSAVSDSLRFAFDHRLPIIYVQRAAHANTNSASLRIKSSQLPAIPVDQNDAVAVYRVAYEAIDKARRGVGPTIIQCVHYSAGLRKLGGNHVDPDDPLEQMERQLRKKSLWSDEFKRSLEENFREDLKRWRGKRKQGSPERNS
jgi:TPP-dependent pyruvate/acetoin dehydrogenase alpha subunit